MTLYVPRVDRRADIARAAFLSRRLRLAACHPRRGGDRKRRTTAA